MVVDCEAHDDTVIVPPAIDGHDVVEIGEAAFSPSSAPLALAGRGPAEAFTARLQRQTPTRTRNAQIRRVVLPEGLRVVRRAAFRGLNGLREIDLPESLEEIEDLAFSCTGIGSVLLPASCTRLSRDALRTGPETLTVDRSYRTSIQDIDVMPENPAYRMCGSVLCKRLDGGSFEALFCPKEIDIADLEDVGFIAETSFTGSSTVGTLRVRRDVRFASGPGLTGNSWCKELVVVGANGQAVMELAFPIRRLCEDVMAVTRDETALDLEKLACAYDEAIPLVEDRLVRARLMVARLARPSLLHDAYREAFSGWLSAEFDAVVANFGARGEWRQFDLLADAGLLGKDTVARAIDVLARLSDAASIGYLLGLKQARFGEGSWAYDL